MYNTIIKTTKQHFIHSDQIKFRRDYLRTPLSLF